MTVTLPAGLSSDTLNASSSTPPPMHDDQWSDAHDTVETDDERDIVEEVNEHQEDLTIRPPKLNTPTSKPHEIHTSSPTVSSPTTAQEHASEEVDASSVHSMPVVQVTEPTSPSAPMTSRSTSSTFPSSQNSTLAPARAPAQDRRARHRTTLDTRTSNRFSGFFSNLIHRRDHPPTPTRDTMATEPPPTTKPHSSSRASSPIPSRPSTPPPSLPPPDLTDLGLALSTITSHLSPSHFSSPPSSGAFLAPNYLLLCHAQGLDVLPLVSPPAIQPYTLIRRVPFKSVVVMEHRGVLVAIAGRRDGVRVYALEEVKRAVEWRMDVEIRREREQNRRDEAKKAQAANIEASKKPPAEREAKSKLTGKDKAARRASVSAVSPAPSPGIPRTPTIKRSRAPPQPSTPAAPAGPPPAYTPSTVRSRENSTLSINPNPSRARTTSVNDVLAGTINRRHASDEIDRDENQTDDLKGDWASSDDEAINVVAAPSGSQALDERTSAAAASGSTSIPTAAPGSSNHLDVPMPNLPRSPTSISIHSRRNRPGNLELSLTRANTATVIPPAPPSPTPTLLTLQQALLSPPGSMNTLPTRRTLSAQGSHPDLDADADEDDDGDPAPSTPATPTRERISLAEALFESRLPDLPPAGTQQPQEAILLSSVASGDEDAPPSPRTSESHSTFTRRSTGDLSNRRRRRWSVLDGIFTPSSSALSQSSIPSVPENHSAEAGPSTEVHTDSEMRERTTSMISRSQSTRLQASSSSGTIRRPHSSRPPSRPSTAPEGNGPEASAQRLIPVPPVPATTPTSHSRFLPRIITNAFLVRRSDDRPPTPRTAEADARKSATVAAATQAPAPKLEYVKLPGTKGSVMVKAVETAKKSFLAILCGDNGEKVELFAGTYRTALGLSRTFILPDSPRSLELQLQGDDLVEVFLVFSQNVFGLEPATVRVREVRIGRAERRAARRRARETRAADSQTNDAAEGGDADGVGGDEDTSVNVSIGVTVTPASPTGTDEGGLLSALPSPSPSQSVAPLQSSETSTVAAAEALNATDELITLATAQMSPYTTFQQLTFAPRFPLASISDDYIIPPTYPSFIEYRNEHEPEVNGSSTADLSQVQFSPPGLPVPAPMPPSKWYYKDPKNIVHGPWKTSLMQTWYQDGLLPPELPVRREEDTAYMLLKELRLQCLDPTHPFRSSPTQPPPSIPQAVPLVHDPTKPLLMPISLLTQPRHFGPPALFYSSRGGHSTTIVDARGRSVLKGRFLWSSDEADDEMNVGLPRLGDVKRLEAFDVEDRAVLVALRQGGVEVVDFGDALLKPADHSRMLFPHFHPPQSSINRRGPFVWKIGAPISSTLSSPSSERLPTKFPAHRLMHVKKQSTGPSKSPGRPDFSLGGDQDPEHPQEEVLFLGRKNDDIYLCERRTGSFRILRLSPNSS